MKNKEYNYTAMVEKFVPIMMKDEKRFQAYNEYMWMLQMENKRRFGDNIDWNEISIREKCYHGWMRLLAFANETIINGRWAYWHDIRITQEVKNKPIPQLNFHYSYEEQFRVAASMIKRCLDAPKHIYYNGYKAFEMFIDWLLYSFGSPLVKELPGDISDAILEHWYRNFDISLLLAYPADYLVTIASELYSSRGFNVNQFYPTPNNIVQFMTAIVYGNYKDMDEQEREKMKYCAVNEPCLGSGTMLLHASNFSLRLYGQDIDLLMVKMASVNFYLYVPWAMELDDQTESLLEKEYQKINKEAGQKVEFGDFFTVPMCANSNLMQYSLFDRSR